jgi:hypothetical protein
VHKVNGKKAVDLKVAPDNDCGTCHGAGATALVGPQAALPTLPAVTTPRTERSRAPPSLPPEGPYRPQWPRLASPARRATPCLFRLAESKVQP